MKLLAPVLAALFALSAPAPGDDKVVAQPPIALKLVAKTDKYKFNGSGKTPAEYKTHLADVAKAQERGEAVRPPKPPAVDLVLQLTNTTKNEVTIFVGGDSNVYTFELTGGDGTATLGSGLAFTADFKLPKAVTLAPGKSHEIPVKQLADGSRGAARYVYWTGPGEYKLSAKYTLSDANGGRGTELKSEPVKITVTEK